MTWQGMCGSGVGIGGMAFGIPMSERRKTTHVGRRQVPTGCFGAAVTSNMRSTAGRRIATDTPRPTPPKQDSVPSYPRVSELNSQSGAVESERGTSGD